MAEKEENKDQSTTNFKDRAEEVRKTVSERAEEIADDAKRKAENLADRAMGSVEKIVNDVFKKNKLEDAEFTEELTDPKEIEILELKKELEELRDKYVRLYADFDNHKKRTAKEKLELILTAGKDIIKELLPVLDDFERAMKAVGEGPARDGMQLIYNKLVSNLSAKGLKAMETVGKDFNVEEHEAVTEIPVGDEQAGKVVDEVEKGYFLNDKIIRFAKVVVGK
jgi:molecular chaperone GrpE